MCSDLDAPNWGQCGDAMVCGGGALTATSAGATAPKTPWVKVNIKSGGTSSVIVDLSPLMDQRPIAIRYVLAPMRPNDHTDSRQLKCQLPPAGMRGATMMETPAALRHPGYVTLLSRSM